MYRSVYKKVNEISAGESPDERMLPSLFTETPEHIQYSGKHSKQYHNKEEMPQLRFSKAYKSTLTKFSAFTEKEIWSH